MRTDRATGSNKGTSESSRRMITLNALINGAPETAAAEVLKEYSDALRDQFSQYIAKVALKMLEENPNEEPAGEEQAIAAAPLPDEALGEGHAIDAALLPDEVSGSEQATDAALLPLCALGEEQAIAAAPLPGEALGEEKFIVVADGNRANTDSSDSSGGILFRRTNTKPNDTEVYAADRSGNARALRKQSKNGIT